MTGSLNDAEETEQPENGPGVPSFVRLGKAHFDGWLQPPSRGWDMDFALGEIYGDQALDFARKIKNPDSVSAVLAAMMRKCVTGEITPGGLEAGFNSRIARSAYVGGFN